jgi:hypothetical protein
MVTHRFITTFALLAAGMALAPAARGTELLRKELATVAQAIKQVVDEEKQEAVAVGEVTGPAQLDTNAGPGIQQLLIAELQALKVSVQKKANLSVKGRYAKVPDPKDPTLILIKLTIQVLDANDEVKQELRAEVRGNLDIAQMLALTVALPPKADAKARNEEINDRVTKPEVFVQGSKVQARKGSPYAVEIRVKPYDKAPAQPRPAKVENGLAFVPIQRDELYEVHAFNNASHEAAVTLTVDGIDVFAFSDVKNPKTGRPQYTHYVVAPGKDLPIVGWHRTNKLADSFKVTAFAESAAAKLLRGSSRVGTITVTFHAAWSGDTPPDDERGSRDAGNATGFGPPRETNLKEVQRRIGVLREAISIRYTKGPG